MSKIPGIHYSVDAGGGAKNYLSNGDFESNTTSGWSLARSTLDANKTLNQPFSSWSAAAGTLNLSLVGTGAQLGGTKSLALSSSGATTAGDFLVSDAFTIDKEDQAKVLSFSFYYQVALGGETTNSNFSGTSSNSVGVLVYDVTNNIWLQPAGVFNLNQTSGVGRATGTFQTNSNTTQLRLAVYFPNATVGALTLYLDDFSVGPQTVQYGAPVTDWQTYTPTISGASIASSSGRWRRVGDSMEIRTLHTFSGGASGVIYIDVPTGYSIDPVKMTSTTYRRTGEVKGYDQSTGLHYIGNAVQDIGNQRFYIVGTGVSAWNTTAPFTWAVNDEIETHILIPIVGWSSTVQMSNDTDTRVVAAKYSGGSSAYSAGGILQYNTLKYDTHGAVTTGASWKFTAPVSGYYRVQLSATRSPASTQSHVLYVSNSAVQFVITNVAATTSYMSGGTTVYVNAGQYIDIRTDNAATIEVGEICIERLSGPSAIAATETVALQRYSASGQTINSSVASIVDFPSSNVSGTQKIDTHGSWRAASGVYSPATGTWSVTNPGFVAPVSGTYQVSGTVGWAQSAFTTVVCQSYVVVNGTAVFSSNDNINSAATGIKISSYSGIVKLNAGDVVQIVAYQDTGTAKSLQNFILERTSFNIVRVGN